MASLKDKLPAIDPRGFVLPLLLIVVWQAVTSSGWVDTRIIVPPSAVLTAGWKWLNSGLALESIAASLFRDASGFVLGAAAGITIGLLFGTSNWSTTSSGRPSTS